MKRYIIWIAVLFAVAMPDWVVAADSEVEWDRSNHSLPLFTRNTIYGCPQCKVLVVVAVERPIGKELEDVIKKVSNRPGSQRESLAAIVRRAQVLEFSPDLVALKCNLPGGAHRSILFYADKAADFCATVPFEKEEVLREALEYIYGHMATPDIAQAEVGSLVFRQKVESVVSSMGVIGREMAPYLKDLATVIAAGRAKPRAK